MNARKHRRKASKIGQKLDRTSQQNRRTTEGKANITTRRVTLLPGFLINGFTSNTVQKTTAQGDAKKRKNHLLSDNLQGLLEQKDKHPRRSQRIFLKHYQQRPRSGSLTSSGTRYDNLDLSSPISVHTQNSADPLDTISFKPILKNDSKSLFKDISERFSKVNIDANNAVYLPPEDQLCTSNRFNCNTEETGDNNLAADRTQVGFNELLLPQSYGLTRFELNRFFCRKLEQQIGVRFKRNIPNECKQNVKKEIRNVNLMLEGKIPIPKVVIEDYRKPQTNDDATDTEPASKFFPVSPYNWVYTTPPNQKTGVPPEGKSQLQAAVLCYDENQRDLYELNQKFSSNMMRVQNVPIDNRFMKKVAEVKKTPANFGFRGCWGDVVQPVVVEQPWGFCDRTGELDAQKELFVNPNVVNPMTRPMSMPKPILNTRIQEHIPTPRVLPADPNDNFNFLQNVTFIEDGNEFRMQHSQSETDQRKKRKLSDEDPAKHKNLFITDTGACDRGKIFNFDSQERNMFDFGQA